MNYESGSWHNWREHVLSEIKRSNENLSILATAVADLHVETAKLQVKSSIWGVVGGMVPMIMLFLVEKFK